MRYRGAAGAVLRKHTLQAAALVPVVETGK
jgi:hypothetical protein